MPSQTELAVQFVTEVFGVKVRKGSGLHHLYHLFAVANIVGGFGGGDHEQALALLHDIYDNTRIPQGTIEALFDRLIPVELRLLHIRRDLPWAMRKAQEVDTISVCNESVALVMLADKIDNLMTTDRLITGLEAPARNEYWSRFNAQDAMQSRFYFDFVDAARKNPEISGDEGNFQTRCALSELIEYVNNVWPDGAL